jgi:hypothetical protein
LIEFDVSRTIPGNSSDPILIDIKLSGGEAAELDFMMNMIEPPPRRGIDGSF